MSSESNPPKKTLYKLRYKYLRRIQKHEYKEYIKVYVKHEYSYCTKIYTSVHFQYEKSNYDKIWYVKINV